MSVTNATAHEVVHSIADLTVGAGQAELVIRLNIEAQVSGIDLDDVTDMDDADNAADYDALRRLGAAEIEALVPDLLARWNALPLLSAGGPVVLSLVSVRVPDEPDLELPRISDLVLRAELPRGVGAVEVTWPQGAGDLVLRQQGVDAPYTGLVSGGSASGAIAVSGGGAAAGWRAFADYVPVGFDHILPKGLDHILFVLGLFFLSTRMGPLLWQVSAFTLAHTVTLALGVLGLVTVPGAIVEPLIAASIVYVAVENIFARGMSRWRLVVVFGFGLLHGLGFASVLGEFGLPEGTFVAALIGFNVGVELGQLSVIALAAGGLWLGCRAAELGKLTGVEGLVAEYPVMFRAWSMTASLIIAAIAIYWVIARTVF